MNCRISRLRLVKTPLIAISSNECFEHETVLGVEDKNAITALDSWLKLAVAADSRTKTDSANGQDEIKIEASDVTVSSGTRKEVIFTEHEASTYWQSSGSCPHWVQVLLDLVPQKIAFCVYFAPQL